MSLTLLSNLLYIGATLSIIIVAGHKIHSWGVYYILIWIPDKTAHLVNDTLLIGYYLVNIGYAFITISGQGRVMNIIGLADNLAYRIGSIVLVLGIMHYLNLISIAVYTYITNKNTHNI